MKRLPYFNTDTLKDYKHSLYQMSYPHWTYKCYSTDDGFPVTPLAVKDVIETAKSLRHYAVGLLSITVAIVSLIGFNMLVYLCNRKSFIKNFRARNISFARLIITFILCLISAGLLAKMYMDSDPHTLSYLSVNTCSKDEILNQSFVRMNEYFESMRVKHWVVISILILIVALDVTLSIVNIIARYRKRRNKKIKKMAKGLLKKHIQND